MLPDTDGFEVLKEIRARGETPVLMLSALDEATDKVLGLELGADDYLTKPFDVRELNSRIKALEDLVRAESAKGEDFDRNTYEKVEFAEDASGTQWALVEATTYTKSDTENGTSQTYIFNKADGEWKLISSGTSGYSEGVPQEIQEEFNIEGQ